jgi:opacity protein-like surface antigen
MWEDSLKMDLKDIGWEGVGDILTSWRDYQFLQKHLLNRESWFVIRFRLTFKDYIPLAKQEQRVLIRREVHCTSDFRATYETDNLGMGQAYSFNLGRVETDGHRSGTEYSSLCYTCDTYGWPVGQHRGSHFRNSVTSSSVETGKNLY